MMSIGVTFYVWQTNALAFLNPHLYHVGYLKIHLVEMNLQHLDLQLD